MVRISTTTLPDDTYPKTAWTPARSSNLLDSNYSEETRPTVPQDQQDTYTGIEMYLKERGVEDFAIALRNNSGRPETYTSPSLRSVQSSFQEQAFGLIARVPRSSARSAPYPIQGYGINDSITYGRRQSESTDSSAGQRYGSQQIKHEDLSMDGSFSSRRRKRPRNDSQSHLVTQTKSLPLYNSKAVKEFLQQRFKDLQQSACKVCAKAFVKYVEPRKQTNYPYTGGEARAPPWWPLVKDGMERNEGIRHKEPDHLLKPGGPRCLVLPGSPLTKTERVLLLVHIVLIICESPEEKERLGIAHLTVDGLHEKCMDTMQVWFTDKDHPDNLKKRSFFREIFKVARQYERYLNGELGNFESILQNKEAVLTNSLDETASVMVSHGDPSAGLSDSEEDTNTGLQYGEETMDQDYTPASSIASPRDTISPLSHPSTNMHPDYNIARPHYQQLSAPAEEHHYNDHAATYRPTHNQSLYSPSPSNAYSQDVSRRQNHQWQTQSPLSVNTLNGAFPSATPTPVYPSNSWTNQTQQLGLSSSNYTNTYTTAQPQNSHPMPYLLPPPQPGTSSSYQQNSIYHPPPPQQDSRTCVLPGSEPPIPQTSYDYLQAPYATSNQDLRNGSLQH